MDRRFLRYYEDELQHLRDVGGEFAKSHSGIAAKLGLDAFTCSDPYVERLLEGFAFLAARVQLKLDAEFPHFTDHLLELLYPDYLAPTPSMALVRLQPDLRAGLWATASSCPVAPICTAHWGRAPKAAVPSAPLKTSPCGRSKSRRCVTSPAPRSRSATCLAGRKSRRRCRSA